MASPRRETSIAGVLGATQVDDGPRGLMGPPGGRRPAILRASTRTQSQEGGQQGHAVWQHREEAENGCRQETAAAAQATTPSTRSSSQDEESYVSDDSQL